MPDVSWPVLDELPSLLTAGSELEALAVAMIVESEFGITLTDAELTPEALGDRGRLLAVLERHGVH